LVDVQDGVIAVALQRALRSNPRTRRADIEVDVDEGVVSLSGKAPAAAARDAEVMARRVEGVKNVVNTIDIEEPERPEKAERAEPPEGTEPPPGQPHGPGA